MSRRITNRQRQQNAGHKRPSVIIFVLMHHKLILQQVFDILMIHGMLVKKNPANMTIPKATFGVMRIQFGIGIFSPPLDAKGNSVRGILACQELSKQFGLHIFESGYTGTKMSDLLKPVRGG